MSRSLTLCSICLFVVAFDAPVYAEGGPMEIPVGKPIELLDTIEISSNVVSGTWNRVNNAYVCEPSGGTLMVPVAVTGSYEISLKYVRRTKPNWTGIILPIGNRQVLASVDANEGKFLGLQYVDRKFIGVDSPAAMAQDAPSSTGETHELSIRVTERNNVARINMWLDHELVFQWSGGVDRLFLHGNNALPQPNFFGIVAYKAIVDFQSLQLTVLRGGAYKLGREWENPLTPVFAEPTPEIAKQCISFNGKRYYFSSSPMMYPDAQQLATKLKGRLVTISSSEEEAFLLEQGRGVGLWLSGWRTPVHLRSWRDERNRTLRFTPRWSKNQPDNKNGAEWCLSLLTRQSSPGLNDAAPGLRYHACIEWGEEYEN